jgi:hypothetical protein
MAEEANGMSYDDIMAAAVANQLDQSEKAAGDNRAAQEAFNSQAQRARKLILDKLSGDDKKTEYPLEVQQMANAMMTQPFLIAPMQKFMNHLVSKINTAMNDAIMEALGEKGAVDPPPQP